MSNKYPNTEQLNIPVYIDGELDPGYGQPELHTAVLDGFRQQVGKLASYVCLEAKMLAYDAWNHTSYHAIRHDLIREKRNREFEAAIGLIVNKRNVS